MMRTIEADEARDRTYRKRVLACPFCGQPPEIMGSGEEWRGLMIHCVTENCANPSVSYYSHTTALRVWNCRRGTDQKQD